MCNKEKRLSDGLIKCASQKVGGRERERERKIPEQRANKQARQRVFRQMTYSKQSDQHNPAVQKHQLLNMSLQ